MTREKGYVSSTICQTRVIVSRTFQIHCRLFFQIRIVRPPNYAFAIFIGVLLSGIGCILYVRRKSLEFIYNKNYWAIGAVVSITQFSSKRPKLGNAVLMCETSKDRTWIWNYESIFLILSNRFDNWIFCIPDNRICDDIWPDVEPYQRTTICTQEPTKWRDCKFFHDLADK